CAPRWGGGGNGKRSGGGPAPSASTAPHPTCSLRCARRPPHKGEVKREAASPHIPQRLAAVGDHADADDEMARAADQGARPEAALGAVLGEAPMLQPVAVAGLATALSSWFRRDLH